VKDKILARAIVSSPEIQNLRRKYVRDEETGAPRGVLVSFLLGGKLYVGHSFCALEKKDFFTRSRALLYALEDAYELTELNKKYFFKRVPHFAMNECVKFWDRNEKYLNSK